jgi:predicted dehydrogenase
VAVAAERHDLLAQLHDGAEVDDQSMTLLKFADGKLGYVGASWTSPGVFAVRVFGSKGLVHHEIDFATWDTPSELHKTATLYIQRGKDGYAKREQISIPESDMFRAELDMFAHSCRTGASNELSARNGNAAVAAVYAALRSIEQEGAMVRLADVIADAQARVAGQGGLNMSTHDFSQTIYGESRHGRHGYHISSKPTEAPRECSEVINNPRGHHADRDRAP